MEERINKEYTDYYDIIGAIGKGRYSIIYKGKEKRNNEFRAIKVVDLDNIKLELRYQLLNNDLIEKNLNFYVNGLIEDFENMKLLSKNNINPVKCYEYFLNKKHFVFIMELCDKNLNDYLKEKKTLFNKEVILNIMSQLNNTFQIMKDNKIIHGNLNSEHILIKYNNDKTYTMKITGYRSIKRVEFCEYISFNSLDITFNFLESSFALNIAPEILEGKKYNYKCDLWSIGLILYILYFGETPSKKYGGKYAKFSLQKITDKELDVLITNLLEKDPSKRLSWEEYFNHPFFKSFKSAYTNNIKLIYELEDDSYEKIFGSKFVINNNNNIDLIINGVKSSLVEVYKLKKGENNIQIIIKNKITNLENMFSGCNSLKNIEGLKYFDTKYINNFSYMFYDCDSLSDIKPLEKWNVSNGNNFSYMFYDCDSLSDIKPLEKWNVSNGNNFSYMFSRCKLLSDIKPLEKWNVSNGKDFSYMFSRCKLLSDIKTKNKMNISNRKVFLEEIILDDRKKKEKKEDNENEFNIINNDEDIEKSILNLKTIIIRNENLRYLPQIEIKFNKIEKITEKIIKNLKSEICNLLKKKEDNFSIIEIKKGSLIVLIALQFIIFNEIKKNKDFKLQLEQFNSNIKEELKKIYQKIKDYTFRSLGSKKPDDVNEDMIYLSKETINNIIMYKKEKGFENIDMKKLFDIQIDDQLNIYEISNNINIEEVKRFYNEISADAEEQERNQFKILNRLDEIYKVVNEEIEKALKNSYFEFKRIYFIINIDEQRIEEYKNRINDLKSNGCNIETNILYHGTTMKNAINIVSNNFDLNRSHNGAIGKGIYLTDSLDYAGIYSRGNYFIPRIGDQITFIVSQVYYDSTQKITYFKNERDVEVTDNGVKCCYGYYNLKIGKLSKNDFNTTNRPVGKEFLIPNENQVLPLYSIIAKRIEYLVIWRDYNFNPNNPNNYSKKIFEEMLNFHKEIKRIISIDLSSKIYYVKTTEEALELIERKKYSKIIIITNASNNAESFIKKAREIIGSDTIVVVSSYYIPFHISWIKQMNNTLLLNGIYFHSKFFQTIMRNQENQREELRRLRIEVINYYSSRYQGYELREFNENILNFRNFRNDGNYADLTFNRVSDDRNKLCRIF